MSGWKRCPVWALYLACFLALDGLSHRYTVEPLGIALWHPQVALGLLLLLRHGLKNAPALWLAAWLAECVVRGAPPGSAHALVYPALSAVFYTAMAAVLLHVGRMDLGLRSMRDLVWLTAVAAAGTLGLAAASVAILSPAGTLAHTSAWVGVTRHGLADLIGILVLLPLLLLLLADRPGLAKFRPNLERLLQIASIGSALWLIFGLEVFDTQKFFYPLFLPLIWIAMRHGIWGVVTANLLTQLGLTSAILWSDELASTAIDAQHMMLTLAATGLFMGMAVTERWRLQKVLSLREVELNQALRFAGAAEMTSALAHELNQPLAAISNYARACQMMVTDSASVHPLLADTVAKVVREVGRAGESVHRLREFFRFGTLRRERLSAHTLLHEVARVVEPHCKRHGVVIVFAVDAGLPPAWADRVQIEIVLHNLLLNAVEALAGAKSSRREVLLEAAAAADNAGWLEVAVRDFGPGVDSSLTEGLFHAFATTKTEGMGLGLAISRSLVEAHEGRLWLDASATPGARFCFTLPMDGHHGVSTEEARTQHLHR
jgi:two-component system, LuxR family, sensor kinase FixL